MKSLSRRFRWLCFTLIFLVVAASFVALVTPSTAQVHASSDDYTYSTDLGETTILAYDGPAGNVVIPAELGGFPVTKIGASAFRGRGLTEVTIPNTVRDIDMYAFEGNELTWVSLPPELTIISMYCFANNDLEYSPLMDNVTQIQEGAFANNQMEYVFIPRSVHLIGDYAFDNNQINMLILKWGLESVGYEAFASNLIVRAHLPSSMTTIAALAFSNNPLVHVTIPASVDSFGAGVFSNSSAQFAIYGEPGSEAFAYAADHSHPFVAAVSGDFAYTVENGSATITNYLGSGGDIAIPPFIASHPVTAIGPLSQDYWDDSFSEKELTEVEIPDSVTQIGYRAFASNSLTAVDLPASLVEMGDHAFYHNQISTITFPVGLHHIRDGVFKLNKLTSLVIHEGIQTIGNHAFGFNLLSEVFIPDSVTSLGGSSFMNNYLTTVRLPAGLTHLPSYIFIGNSFHEIDIPDSVTHIGDYAFYANKLETLTLPTGLESIGFAAFMFNALPHIRIPSGTEVVGQWAFRYNPLETAVVPSSVTEIGDNAFQMPSLPADHLTIYGVPGSRAESYAGEHSHLFRSVFIRIADINRYTTAVAISQAGWPEGTDTVLIARGDDFPDSLAGVPLANQLGGPILLTTPTSLHPDTRTEIQRLGASRVIILGGTGAVSAAVEADLQTIPGVTVDRLGGVNRYATAALIAEEMLKTEPFRTAFIASGSDFPDALAAAAYAAQLEVPVLLTDKNILPGTTRSIAENLLQVIIAGGPAAVSEAVYDDLLTLDIGVQRIYGTNRYQTAVELAHHYLINDHELFIATGLNFPDALAGGVLAAQNHTGILLVSGTHSTLPSSVSKFIIDHNIKGVTVLGGIGAVSTDIEHALYALLD